MKHLNTSRIISIMFGHQIFILLCFKFFVHCYFIDDFLSANDSQTDYTKCKTLRTIGYGYKKFFEITELEHHSSQYILDLHFAVQAPRDAHILLTPSTKVDPADPVYEIVLGGGLNTFSDIRRRKRTNTKSTQKTVNLLSIHEMKPFWLHVSTDGLIEVGEEGEQVAFLSWRDTDPLPIRYISFCSWSSVEANWRFDCKRNLSNINNNDTGSSLIVEVPQELTPMQHLRNDLFENYDPYVIPSNGDGTLYLVIQLDKLRVVKVDETKSSLTVSSNGDIKWHDSKLRWTPSAYGNITHLQSFHRQIWVPEIHLYNSANFGEEILTFGKITVWYNGLVQWSPKIRMEVWCDKDDLKDWPYDQKMCQFVLGLWSQAALVSLKNASVVEGIEQTSSEWRVISLKSGSFDLYTPWIHITGDIFASNTILYLNVKLQRNNQLLSVIYYSILFVIGFSMILTFLMSPIKTGKIGCICFQLFLLSLLLVVVLSKLPPKSANVPKIINLCLSGLIASTILLIVCIITLKIEKGRHFIALPATVSTLLKSSLIQWIFLIQPSTKDSMQYGKLDENQEKNKEMMENQECWLTMVVILERITMFVYITLLSIVFFHIYLN